MSVTGQGQLDSYNDAGVFVAISLANDVASRDANDAAVLQAIASIIAFDPPTHRQLRPRHVAGFVALAAEMRSVLVELADGNVDAAAARLNRMLADHPAYPHLANDDGEWRLHHHPATAELVSMYTSICAEAIARLVGTGHAHRFGLCADPACRRSYLDQSKNSSRRFCTLTCQNRMKTAAFRARRQQSAGTDNEIGHDRSPQPKSLPGRETNRSKPAR